MIYRHTQQQIDDYYQRIGINQSSLKIILTQGVQAFYDQMQEAMHTNETYFEEKEYFLIGSAVDCKITQGDWIFKEKYYHSEVKKPAEKPMNIVRMLYEKLVVRGESVIAQDSVFPPFKVTKDSLIENIPLSSFRKELYDLMDIVTDSKGTVGYYLNNKIPSEKLIKGKPDERTWLEDKRVDRLLGDGLCEIYWKDLFKSKGKTILSDEQSQCIDTVYMSLTTHPFTSYLFDDKEYADNEDLDIIYQLPLYWEETLNVMTPDSMQLVSEDCKCMIDATLVNHKKQTISPLDTKTTYEYITMFPRQIRAKRYDMQAAWYKRGIFKNKKVISELLNRDISNYKVDDFAFVVESTKHTGTPLIFPISKLLEDIGTVGDNDKLEGCIQALKKFMSFKSFDYSVNNIMASKNGVLFVDENFKTNLIEI